MKLVTLILTLACSSAFLFPVARAQQQGSVAGTYTGANGSGDRFMVNIYGRLGEAIAIEVKAGGGDGECGRSFYITGTMLFDANNTTASIGGPMLRCTEKALLGDPCNHQPFYEVGYTGTVTRTPYQGAQMFEINITYPDERWLPEDCPNGKKRTEVGKDKITLTYVGALPTPLPQRAPGWNDWLRKTVDQGNQAFRDLVSGRTVRRLINDQ